MALAGILTVRTNKPPKDQQSLTEEQVFEFDEVLPNEKTPVVKGVKLLGLRSKNGRLYPESTLKKAIALYEGAKVNVNHPKGDPLAPRDYRDRIGLVSNIRLVEGKGLYGDLAYNPKHSIAESLEWYAENRPEMLGLSHNVLAKTKRTKGVTVVESIERVVSVDLVADPATNDTLFEHNEGDNDDEPLTETIQAIADSIPETEADWAAVFENITADPSLASIAVATDADGDSSAMRMAGNALIEAMIAIIRDGEMDSAAKLKKIRLLLSTNDRLSDTREQVESQIEQGLGELKDSNKARDEAMQLLTDQVEILIGDIKQLKRSQALREGLEGFGLNPSCLHGSAARATLRSRRRSGRRHDR